MAVLVAAVVAAVAEMVVVIAVDAGVEVVVAVVGVGMVVAVVDDDAAAAVGTADVGLQNALQKPESVGGVVLVHQDGNRWVASGS